MKHKYLDYLNIEYSLEDNAAINKNIYNTNNRLSKHLDIITQEQKEVPPDSIRYLNLAVEKFIYILLSKSSITNNDRTDITTHYDKYRREGSNLLDEDISRTLTYGKSSIWFGDYGSLLHDSVERKIVDPYMSSSELARISTLTTFNSLNIFNSDLYTQSIKAIGDNTKQGDIDLYNIPRYLITRTDFSSLYQELTFIGNWVRDLFTWYLDSNNKDSFYNHTQTQTERVLFEIAQFILRHGVFQLDDLGFELMHNRLLDKEINIYNKIKINVNLLDLEGLDVNSTPYKLAIDLRNNIKPSYIQINLLLDLLTVFAVPGGFNKLLLAISIELLNRAYIITHPNNTIYSLNTYNDFENIQGWLGGNNLVRSIEDKQNFLGLVGRVQSLCNLSAETLKKCSISDLNLLGARIQRVFNLPNYDKTRNKELI